jgi:hypothetical protein
MAGLAEALLGAESRTYWFHISERQIDGFAGFPSIFVKHKQADSRYSEVPAVMPEA